MTDYIDDVPVVSTGDWVDAAWINQYIGDNLRALDAAVAAVQVDVDGLLAISYPVGSIYISVVSTNPSVVFGFGTWVAFGAGRVLVGLDAGQTEFDTVEETGGAKTHTLTSTEMPAHTHTIAHDADVNSGGSVGTRVSPSGSTTTSSAGGGAAHNNLQPYIVVYMFKRTA